MNGSNPLFDLQIPLAFDRVQPEHVAPAFDALLTAARDRIDEIAAVPAPRTYEDTLLALDLSTEPLDRATGVVRHLEAVHTSPALRDAWNAAQPAVVGFYSGIPLHEQLWNAVQSFAATPEAASLAGVHKRFLDKTIESFRRHGAALDAEGKKRLQEIDVELATITTRFGQNVLDATAAWEYYIEDQAALAGLPDSAIEAARASAASKNKEGWRFSLQQPSYLAVMTYLDARDVREIFWRAYNTRAAGPNAVILPRVLELRRAKAQLLGYSGFADYALADRMAKTGDAAHAFVLDLASKTEAAFHRENSALTAFAASHGGPDSLSPWDIGYWAERQRQAKYDFNEEDLRPYLPVERVLGGLFELVQRLYGIRVAEAPGVAVWHPDVRHYEVRDEDGSLLGTFYADWFPRDTKRGGAWMDSFITGPPQHVGLMCGNLTPPVGGKPSLLTHREAETIFHEFGHLLHHLLSKVEVKSLAGTNVAWDFVELPSQIMENWCWERESLDLFARHWQTGESIPEELFHKMKAARTFRGANSQMRQLGFAAVDLSLHIHYSPESDGSAVDYANKLLARFTPAPLPAEYAMICGFTHLFSDPTGYGAGYYSYKWAEVLDADAFTRFRRDGIFSREAGRAFRDNILAKGNSEDPAGLFRSFMGRDPDPSALLERLGLIESGELQS